MKKVGAVDGGRVHPLLGKAFDSPVPPGSGWPGDPATATTPRAEAASEVGDLASSAPDLAHLLARQTVCRACPRLVQWREQVASTPRASFADQAYWGRPVAGFGDELPRVLIVGLAPAAHGGNRTGRLFTGDSSGDWIFAALNRTGFASQARSTAAGDGMALHGVRMLAPVRCAPPDNKPTPVERDTCAPWMDAEVRRTGSQVRAVLALGSFAWSAVMAMGRRLGWEVPRPKPAFAHGAEVRLRAGSAPLTLVGSYHVSQQNTFTGRLTEPMLDAVLARCRTLADLP